MYVVTKLWNASQGYDKTLRAFDASLDRLGIEVLDLYLIHWPMPELNAFVETFRRSHTFASKAEFARLG